MHELACWAQHVLEARFRRSRTQEVDPLTLPHLDRWWPRVQPAVSAAFYKTKTWKRATTPKVVFVPSDVPEVLNEQGRIGAYAGRETNILVPRRWWVNVAMRGQIYQDGELILQRNRSYVWVITSTLRVLHLAKKRYKT